MTDRTDAELAALHAAAPDMLEALEGIAHFADALQFREDRLSKALSQWIDAGRAAIAKATPSNTPHKG